jgi:NTP pyrophosphatase (non-canonical NTP hydrolase)
MDITKFLEEVKKQIEFEDKKFSFTKNEDNVTQTLMAASKLSADVGELNKAILKYLDLATKYKLTNFKFEDLENNIAEVLFQVLYVSQITNVDLKSAIQRKIDILEKIEERKL